MDDDMDLADLEFLRRQALNTLTPKKRGLPFHHRSGDQQLESEFGIADLFGSGGAHSSRTHHRGNNLEISNKQFGRIGNQSRKREQFNSKLQAPGKRTHQSRSKVHAKRRKRHVSASSSASQYSSSSGSRSRSVSPSNYTSSHSTSRSHSRSSSSSSHSSYTHSRSSSSFTRSSYTSSSRSPSVSSKSRTDKVKNVSNISRRYRESKRPREAHTTYDQHPHHSLISPPTHSLISPPTHSPEKRRYPEHRMYERRRDEMIPSRSHYAGRMEKEVYRSRPRSPPPGYFDNDRRSPTMRSGLHGHHDYPPPPIRPLPPRDRRPVGRSRYSPPRSSPRGNEHYGRGRKNLHRYPLPVSPPPMLRRHRSSYSPGRARPPLRSPEHSRHRTDRRNNHDRIRRVKEDNRHYEDRNVGHGHSTRSLKSAVSSDRAKSGVDGEKWLVQVQKHGKAEKEEEAKIERSLKVTEREHSVESPKTHNEGKDTTMDMNDVLSADTSDLFGDYEFNVELDYNEEMDEPDEQLPDNSQEIDQDKDEGSEGEVSPSIRHSSPEKSSGERSENESQNKPEQAVSHEEVSESTNDEQSEAISSPIRVSPTHRHRHHSNSSRLVQERSKGFSTKLSVKERLYVDKKTIEEKKHRVLSRYTDDPPTSLRPSLANRLGPSPSSQTHRHDSSPWNRRHVSRSQKSSKKGDALAIAEAYRRKKRQEAAEILGEDEVKKAKNLAKMLNDQDSRTSGKRTGKVKSDGDGVDKELALDEKISAIKEQNKAIIKRNREIEKDKERYA